MLKTVWILTVAAVGGTTRGLNIGNVPRFRAQSAQTGRRVKSARSHFHIVRLLNNAALGIPVFFQGKNQFLKSHIFLLIALSEKSGNAIIIDIHKNIKITSMYGRMLSI
jgi:hypothetical protein